ncbi:MAG: sulfite exporter TauE/SafE family protein [Melioribacteraceae bacterium]|nr:sulfite exporter TauE/SafE family protein [Melioribacteraceae bacterium]
MIEIIGYIAAIFIGITLGLIGGGGSILTVPVLVYIFGLEAVPATAYSLFVVGLTSLIGSIAFMKKDLVSFKTAAVFALPAFLAVFFTRLIIVPAIPDHIITISMFDITKNILIMVLFALLMVGSSYSMIKDKRVETEGEELQFNYPLIFIEGIIVGVLTGLVGAGGGFLIIPALVILAKLPMKLAVGTSLLIISAKSLLGFLGDIGANLEIDWALLAVFSGFAIAGIIIGSFLSKYIPGKKLKPAFGWFVLVMGVYILGREIFVHI